MLTDLPQRGVPTEGLSTHVATRHIYAPFGSDDPAILAYAPGDRVLESDIAALEAAGYVLPEWGNDPPDVLNRKLKEAEMDVAEQRAYDEYPTRYAHLAEDVPTTEEVTEDSKDAMETGRIADTRISGVGTDPEFVVDDAGSPPDPEDIPAREEGMPTPDGPAADQKDAEVGPADQGEDADADSDDNGEDESGSKAVNAPEGDKAVTKTTTRRKPASK